jgi:hypothetical protein
MGSDERATVSPLWLQPLRWAAVGCVAAYYRVAYRIRGWGRFRTGRGPILVVANHQHEIESAVVVASLSLAARSWRYPVFTVSSRRMWEPGFLAERFPWLRSLLRGVNPGRLFSAIGMQPIENDLHARPFVSLAHTLYHRRGDLPIDEVFRERALARLPSSVKTLSDLLEPAHFDAGRAIVTLSELREPYRSEAVTATREQLERDLARFERLQRSGATIFLTPEGFYTGDGKMQRLRGVLTRLAPLARIWLAGISYDPFVGRRLSLLYRIAPAADTLPLDVQLKALRPVTASALLASWLWERGIARLTEREALDAVTRQLADLPTGLFVDPALRRRPAALVRAALAGMVRLGMLRVERSDGRRYVLTQRRHHPQFPRTHDMIVYQANFHHETLDGARRAASPER